GFVDRNMTDDMPILDEVVFKIHKNGYFKLDPLSILENKWPLFYCLPNKSLKEGLKLIHTDNDVHSFFEAAEMNGRIHLYIAHKQQDLGRYYLRNMVWVEEDAALRCLSTTPFSTRIKKKHGKRTKKGLRKNKGSQIVVTNFKRVVVSGKAKMVEDIGLVEENVDVGIKQDVRRRNNVLGLLVPGNNMKSVFK
ncbi:hypothetical protein Tco_1110526, partial [Tanacetum coccineum]